MSDDSGKNVQKVLSFRTTTKLHMNDEGDLTGQIEETELVMPAEVFALLKQVVEIAGSILVEETDVTVARLKLQQAKEDAAAQLISQLLIGGNTAANGVPDFSALLGMLG